jgi:hypothetical protein
MKQINVYFDDSEYCKLVELKEYHKLNWHDFIMTIVDEDDEEVKNGL